MAYERIRNLREDMDMTQQQIAELVLIGKIWYNIDMKAEYKRTCYPSDLTDKQWDRIAEYFPSGNKSKYHKRNLVEAVMYVVKTGCQWMSLPYDYPPYSTVYNFYSRAKQKGIWEKVMQFLVKETRIKAEKDEMLPFR